MNNSYEHMNGESNPRWNGGNSEYHNHASFKKQRLIKIAESNGLCVKCGAEFKHVHHIDGSKDNHSLDNLMVLCRACHYDIHKGRKNGTSKMLRATGMNKHEIAKLSGLKKSKISSLFSACRENVTVKDGILKIKVKNTKTLKVFKLIDLDTREERMSIEVENKIFTFVSKCA